jgi:2-oxoglutarate dehydrogenase E1 component
MAKNKRTTRKSPNPASRPDALADAFRRWGYLCANLDSLDRLAPYEHPDLTEAMAGASSGAITRWKSVYCGPIGVEFMHMIDRERSRWVSSWMESEWSDVDQQKILEQLAAAELFERFMHARYVGSKRYSLEGVAGIIPLMESILTTFAEADGKLVYLAMSHRGRINLMASIVGIPEADLFAGIEDIDPKSVLGSGDVRYHLGATGVHETAAGKSLEIHMVSNPSHLEAVNPVVMGRVRARQQRMGSDGPGHILTLTLHGDAAFAGQGITAETLNLAGLPGYTVHGTIHIIVNNLIGFTAAYPLLHSSRFSADLAKRLSVPIVHVNGEDPEALVRVGKMAAQYRAAFGDDVVVDVIGFRRYGHSEVEDPSTTQPQLYEKIKAHPMLWEIYAERIGASPGSLEKIREDVTNRLSAAQDKGRAMSDRPIIRKLPAYWDRYRGGYYDSSLEVDTAVPADRLEQVAERATSVPAGLHIHPKVKRVFEQRMSMVRGDRLVDWGMAEALAFGSILWDGIPVRLAGEDSRRGTFNQRHAVVTDTETGEEYTPLCHIHPDQGDFTAVDTPLSEAAALGFEYGFSRDYPDALVCWEAQFGDFANGAQTIIDQFIAAGEDKWRLLSGLVILLPHGYEGQGPEHSSARLERFLQLAAEDNIQVCQPSTSSQYFHLLRRQVLRPWRKPLVIFTPKSLLRAEEACSPVETLTSGRFQSVLPDVEVVDPERLLICSGKIAHELRTERRRREDKKTAVVCLAQLYPFPKGELAEELKIHRTARKVVWVQEEPANMGAISYVRPILQRLVGDRHVTTIKRSESASPATGSSKAHALEQQAIVRLAFA